MKKTIYFLFLFYPFLCFAQSLFTEPKMTFIQKPTETISDISFSSGTPITTIQSAIDAKRLAFPNNIIRITISGTFTVTTAPLQLTDRMLLILKNATIIAASNTTATSLISVNNGHYITIASVGTSLLDGNNQFVTGIYVTTSGKTHIDNLTIKNCKSGGIYYTGAGAAVYADAGSATRCTITNCTAFGIYYIDSFNFICTDNTIQTSNIGISVNSDNSA
ncbi:MAG: right-handed parallel beta-helix repeat-containing protein, partial [Paludibacter sp.]